MCSHDRHHSDIASDELILSIARRKYIDHIGTVELLKAAHNDEEQEAVCIVALLDVDDCTARRETDRYDRKHSKQLLAKRRMLQEELLKLRPVS